MPRKSQGGNNLRAAHASGMVAACARLWAGGSRKYMEHSGSFSFRNLAGVLWDYTLPPKSGPLPEASCVLLQNTWWHTQKSWSLLVTPAQSCFSLPRPAECLPPNASLVSFPGLCEVPPLQLTLHETLFLLKLLGLLLAGSPRPTGLGHGLMDSLICAGLFPSTHQVNCYHYLSIYTCVHHSPRKLIFSP